MEKFCPDNELSMICDRLWNADENYLEPGQSYDIDLQGSVSRYRTGDHASGKLFQWLNEEEVFSMPTYRAFRALLDNYESETGLAETVTDRERKENALFIELACETQVMKCAHEYLSSNGFAPTDMDGFKQLLNEIWFTLVRRNKNDRALDSSSFEHVFVGETRSQEVIGFHNWIQFYLQEKLGNIDYKGYYRMGSDNESGDWCRIIRLSFSWKGETDKASGSSFVGTSPEFEFALYTVLHLVLQQRCPRSNHADVIMGGYQIRVTIYPFGRNAIGTAYPSLIE